MERKQTALITFMRHGQKDKSGSLTDVGLEQAQSRGVATKNLDGDVLLFHSGVGRVRDTIMTMAQNIAQMIGIEVRFACMTDTKHVINIVNGSHEPVLTAFLCYFFQDYRFKSADFIDTFNGGVNFAEGFEIAVYSRSVRDYDVELTFRGVTKSLDLDKTRRFAYDG